MTTKGSDLTDRADVRELLSRFYGRVLIDELLAEPFTEVRAKGLVAHLPVMCDFWETMLFRAGLYQQCAAGPPDCASAPSAVASPFRALAVALA